MHRRARLLLALSIAAIALLILANGSTPASANGNEPKGFSFSWNWSCPDFGLPGFARCHAIFRTDVPAHLDAEQATTPSGFGPSDLQVAYSIPTTISGQPTVAIVDAYDDPKAEADLGVYRAQYGLPACTTANGCFKKVSQTGGTRYPRADGGWAQEISLDLDMVSAICPKCKILLVEANSSSMIDLGTAVNYAASVPGVVAISNSYGGTEFSGETTYETRYYNHPGKVITVSSGDSGYGVEFPASSQYVTAVGGTSLKRDSSTRGWSEQAWSGAGSGCSKYITKPSWQKDTGCTRRSVADVSAVADPATGVAVYDSYAYQGYSGWLVFGGTSVSAPIIASVYAAAGNATSVTYGSYPYSHTASLNDVTSGSNGSCGGGYLCTGGAGYDGPTGLDTPSGTTGF
ncbi:MAG: peptidase S8 [Anaerolineae bacterium]